MDKRNTHNNLIPKTENNKLELNKDNDTIINDKESIIFNKIINFLKEPKLQIEIANLVIKHFPKKENKNIKDNINL
jgi:hypothetical protein